MTAGAVTVEVTSTTDAVVDCCGSADEAGVLTAATEGVEAKMLVVETGGAAAVGAEEDEAD